MKLPEKVQQKLKELPDKPGVYLMRDRGGKVIYIGKAVSLRNRVRTYFQDSTLRKADPKLRGLIRSVEDFDFLVLKTETEAMLTEGRFIKEYRPRYNSYFKDDKHFLLLRVNLNDPFPKFQLSRIQKEDGATYFGPYASAGAGRTAKEFVEKRFGIRVCRPRQPGEEDYKHCMNDVIRFCSAPCVGKVTREAYREQMGEACAFLRGERPAILQELREEMNNQAEKKNFEKAAVLRDTYLHLLNATRNRLKGTKSLALRLEDAQKGLQELQEALHLSGIPRVIECFDVSNISGTHAVGSMVCSVDGLPQRNRYRLFRVKTMEGIDDPGMMAEVIRRRYTRVKKEETSLPDLVLVDGGITQLRAARKELNQLGLVDLPLAGLAKRYEELYWDVENLKPPLRLPQDSSALMVLQRIRDEAHRFALTYHRRLRSKRIKESVLDEIPGIGERRKKQILETFGSLTRLSRASVEEITGIPGIGEAMAKAIHQAVSRSMSA